MSKRQKFILTSFVMTLGLFSLQFVEEIYRYQAIGLLTFVSILLSWWSLREALAGIRYLTTIILPTLLTAGVSLFYFLLPSSWVSQLPIVGLFALSFYALLLTENIFSVASIRTIQLLRAAHAVGFLLTLLTSFLLFDTIFSFRMTAMVNAVAVFGISFLIYLQGLWSVNLEEKLSRNVWLYSLFLAIINTQFAFLISLMPTTIAMASLFTTTLVYIQLGIVQVHFQERLFRKTIYEYLFVGFVVLTIFLFTNLWS
jgi:hypothetical protein